MEFVKAHGTGNDFVVVEDLGDDYELSAGFVRAVCDRHFGVGGDGLIRIAPGTSAPFFMDYRNADGSVAEMCGNGVRVVGKYLADRGHVTGAFDLETRAGVKHLELHAADDGCVDRVTVDMGAPSFDRADLPMLGEGEALKEPLQVQAGQTVVGTCLSMGNPHVVVLVDDVDAAPVASLGPLLETHPAFPNKTNVEFVQVVGEDLLRQRTWERGVGETLACGTGACAVAVAGQVRGLTGQRVEIELRGGRLELEWVPGRTVRMTGPAREVAHGTLGDELLEKLGQA
ncbi:MAG TPA: diaminopimelate epimerase [Actinomycetes bacterium]|nr:diaminopimelate epimerase [Actinomycetes bacterium]